MYASGLNCDSFFISRILHLSLLVASNLIEGFVRPGFGKTHKATKQFAQRQSGREQAGRLAVSFPAVFPKNYSRMCHCLVVALSRSSLLSPSDLHHELARHASCTRLCSQKHPASRPIAEQQGHEEVRNSVGLS